MLSMIEVRTVVWCRAGASTSLVALVWFSWIYTLSHD